jgi:hypothetical protein
MDRRRVVIGLGLLATGGPAAAAPFSAADPAKAGWNAAALADLTAYVQG